MSILKGKISPDGWLAILRKKTYKPQFCCCGEKEIPCSDSCPLFGEPEYETGTQSRHRAPLVYLRLCQGQSLVFDEFVDAR